MEKNAVRRPCELLIIGGSAGSLDVLLEIFPKIKTPISFAIVVVIHRKSSRESSLIQLLSSKIKLTVKEVEDKEVIEKSVVYIAPADYHLLVEKTRHFALDYSEKINFCRPSIDVSFESAAEVYGTALTCILLSGANMDGTEGAKAIKEKGGVVIIQNPATAIVTVMPETAIARIPYVSVLDPVQMIDYINSMENLV